MGARAHGQPTTVFLRNIPANMKSALVFLVALLCIGSFTSASARERIKLSYFASRGRAEPIRLLLEYVGVSYKDHRFKSFDDWKVAKTSGEFAFGQVPGLEWCPSRDTPEGCVRLVQSHTIMRFLARKYDAYGPVEQRHWVDLVADGAEDFKSKLSKVVYSADGLENLPEYLETTAPEWLAKFERLKGEIGADSTFFTSDAATHADLYLFYVLELHLRLGGPSLLEPYPQLRAFFDAVARIDNVRQYRASTFRRPQFANGQSGAFDNAAHPPAFTDFGDAWPVAEEAEL